VRPCEGLKDKNALFISRFMKRISPKTVQWIVNKFLAQAGLDGKGYSVHKLRHTAATLMYQQGGVDIRVLKEILGHESLSTTEIYTHLSSTQAKAAIDSSPLANLNTAKQKKTKDNDNLE
jgi:integrase/recombinase XerC